jgi:hypothetical protein
MKKAFEWLLSIDWSGMGKAIVDGLSKAFDSLDLAQKGKDLAQKLKNGFTSALKIGSPSKVFEGYGVNTVEGYSRGIDQAAPAVNDQIADMATPKGGGGGGAGGAGGARGSSVAVNITINVDGSQHKDDQSLVAEMRAQFRNEVTRMFERDATNLGMKRAG